MNSRDMCGIAYVEDLAKAWVISYKIEGRNKTINYVASVGRAYRKALDCVEAGQPVPVDELAEELFSISNRGYIPGFMAWNPGANAQFYEKNGWFQTMLFAWEPIKYSEETKELKIKVKDRIHKGSKVQIVTPEAIWEEEITSIIKTDKETGEKTENVDIAHPGWVDVWISCSKNPGEFAVVRVKAETNDELKKFQLERTKARQK
jgi:putative protease